MHMKYTMTTNRHHPIASGPPPHRARYVGGNTVAFDMSAGAAVAEGHLLVTGVRFALFGWFYWLYSGFNGKIMHWGSLGYFQLKAVLRPEFLSWLWWWCVWSGSPRGQAFTGNHQDPLVHSMDTREWDLSASF